jgi:hypothetical protein
MIMNPLEQDVVSRGAQACKTALDLLNEIEKLNVLYDGAGDIKNTITQPGLDEIESFSEITKSELDDGMYALTATLKTAIEGVKGQLELLAARA